MSFTYKLVMELIYLAILSAGFAYGAVKLFRKGQPLYFQLYVMGCGARVVERMIVCTTVICGLTDMNVSVGNFLGMFSLGLFILSANRGTLDGIVDDRSDPRNKKARRLAIIVPAFNMVACFIITGLYMVNVSVFTGLVIFVGAQPAIIASYYCAKHLLLMDEMQLLKATRPCNILAIAACGVGLINQLLSSLISSEIVLAYIHIIVYALPAVMVVYAVKGAEKWKA